MVQLFIKHTIIILIAVFVYYKILHKQRSKRALATLLICVFCVGTGVLSATVFQPMSNVIPLFQVTLLLLFLTITSKEAIEPSFLACIIAFAISYLAFIVSAVILAGFYKLLVPSGTPNLVALQIFISLFQGLLAFLLFRIRRLRKGMPFLYSKKDFSIIVFVSLFIIFIDAILTSNHKDVVYKVFVITLLFFTILVFFLWRKHLKTAYEEKIIARNQEIANQELSSQSETIRQLMEDRDRLAAIVHRDNKLVPAMSQAVSDFLSHMDTNKDPLDLSKKGNDLLSHLKEVNAQRLSLLNSSMDQLPVISTGLPSLDALFQYMSQKSKSLGINLTYEIGASFEDIQESFPDMGQLNTMLADIIENALIATCQAPKKQVLLETALTESGFAIRLYDSGEVFPLSVLKHLGQKRITTHKDTGGSGIGLFNTCTILSEHHHSFILEEFEEELYSKCITILFDGKNQTLILTARSETLTHAIKRSDMQIIPK